MLQDITEDAINELAVKASEGDDEAMARLVTVIMPSAKARATKLNSDSSRISDDDLTQEGTLTFQKVCLSRRTQTAASGIRLSMPSGLIPIQVMPPFRQRFPSETTNTVSLLKILRQSLIRKPNLRGFFQ